MAIRFCLWGIAVVYLGLDLFVLDGPLRRKIEAGKAGSAESVAADASQGVVARAYEQVILRSQVDRAVQMGLFCEGREWGDISPEELGLRRIRAANELLDAALLRNKILHQSDDYSVSAEEIEAEVARFTRRFPDEESLREALRGQGYEGMKELRLRAEARLQQEKYLLERVTEASEVTDGEALSFYETYRNRFTVPRQKKVRHIFFEQLDRGTSAAKVLAEKTWRRLKNGEDFSQLAAELSDDPQSRGRGGDLGWMAAERIDPQFIRTVMAMSERGPKIVLSTLGVHIVEILDERAERVASFDEVKADIVAAIQADRRELAVKAYRAQLREQAGRYAYVLQDALID